VGDQYSRRFFDFSRILLVAGMGLFYGISAEAKNWPPVPQIAWIGKNVQAVVNPGIFALQTDEVLPTDSDRVDHSLKGYEQPGLIAVLYDTAPRRSNIRVIDRSGQVVHEWTPRWLDVWSPDEGTFVARPPKDWYIHGMKVLPDGSFVANFEHYSTFRMDVCGEIVWKLDNFGHHSVSLGPDNTIWVPAEKRLLKETSDYPAHQAPFRAYQLQQVDLGGEVLKTIDLIDIFFKNDLDGFLFMRSPDNGIGWVAGDTLHLNDIEVVPAGYPSSLFEPGDLLVSMRNIQTLVVVDPHDETIKWTYSGGFVAQHDPDFLPSGNISIFDNRPHRMFQTDVRTTSRVLELDPLTGSRRTIIGDTSERTFFSRITGSHSHLENGNILIVASQEGRLLEFTRDGRLVWRYDARISEMENGRVYNAEVLPAHMDRAFFEAAKRSCEQ